MIDEENFNNENLEEEEIEEIDEEEIDEIDEIDEDIEFDDDDLEGIDIADAIASNLLSQNQPPRERITLEKPEESVEQIPVIEDEKQPVKSGMDSFNEAIGSDGDLDAQTNKEKQTDKVDESPEAIKSDKLTGHIVPTEPSWHLKRNKTGFTLPKEVRENIRENQNYAMIVKENQLIFYAINEEDVPKLNLIKKPKVPTKRTGKKGGRKKRTLKKKPEGPQPEWGNYFLFEFDEQDKLKAVLETAFDKFAANPPNIQEAMDTVKYALVSFMTSSRMHDSRVRQSIIFYLLDIVEKFDQPNLIDFIKDKILLEVKSRFLYQLSLNELAYTAFKVKRYEKAQEFIELCIQDVNKYGESESYAIMDSFKNLINKLTRGVTFLIPQEQLIPIRDSLKSFVDKVDNDYKIQVVELLGKMNFIDDGVDLAKKIMKELPEESPTRDDVKTLIKDLEKKPI